MNDGLKVTLLTSPVSPAFLKREGAVVTLFETKTTGIQLTEESQH